MSAARHVLVLDKNRWRRLKMRRKRVCLESNVQSVQDATRFLETSDITAKSLFLQDLHVGGKGQGQQGFLQLDSDRSGPGQTPPHMRHDQQIQAWAQSGRGRGGQRQVRPVWAVQRHRHRDNTRLERRCRAPSFALYFYILRLSRASGTDESGGADKREEPTGERWHL